MNNTWIISRGGIVVWSLLLFVRVASADTTRELQDAYTKVADGLNNIRKEYPACQPKVYAIMDQLDKIYSMAKGADQKRQSLKQKLENKITENVALKTELVALRSEMSSVKKSLEITQVEADQKLEEEKIKSQQLAQERKDLIHKLSSLDDHKEMPNKSQDFTKSDIVELAEKKLEVATNQPSLSRISTSDPSSPR
jgi:chromosome segregation ATPase